jgi:hypothetical protein
MSRKDSRINPSNRIVSRSSGGRVGQYRLYSMDGPGQLGLPDEIVASDDAEAVSKVRKLKRNALQCEIWKGRKLVTSLRRQDLDG